MWLKCIWSRIDTQTCVAGVFKRSHSNVLPICIFDESWTSVGYSKLSTTNITLSCDCSTITRGNAFYFSFLKCNITFVCFSMTFLNIIPCSLIPTFWKVINNLSLLEHQSTLRLKYELIRLKKVSTWITRVLICLYFMLLPNCRWNESWITMSYSVLSTTNVALCCNCFAVTRG